MFGRRISNCLRVQVLVILTIATAACGADDLEGTYHGPEGAVVLELKDQTATVMFMGETQSCEYESTDEQVVLACPGREESMLLEVLGGTLRRNQDGSLTSSGITGWVFAKRTAG